MRVNAATNDEQGTAWHSKWGGEEGEPLVCREHFNTVPDGGYRDGTQVNGMPFHCIWCHDA